MCASGPSSTRFLESYARGGQFKTQARFIREADAYELELEEDTVAALNSIRRPGEDLAQVIERLVVSA